jgi:hypothetical protein
VSAAPRSSAQQLHLKKAPSSLNLLHDRARPAVAQLVIAASIKISRETFESQ